MKCVFYCIVVLAGLELFPVPTFLFGVLVLTILIVRKVRKPATAPLSELEQWDAAFEKSLSRHNDYAKARDAADKAVKR